MNPQLSGIHHVTAIASDPQQNVDFYVGVLGLRLVKQTVNFDDPGSYHFYYGDGLGNPGTLLTFFAWPGGRRGRRGLGQVTAAALSVGPESLDFWQSRLRDHDVPMEESLTRFGETVLPFYDPDGLTAGTGRGIARRAHRLDPGRRSRRTCHSRPSSVTLPERSPERTETAADGDAWLSRRSDGRRMDALCPGGRRAGRVCRRSGRARSRARPDCRRQYPPCRLADARMTRSRRHGWDRFPALGYGISPVMDREYFHSIYFREPGGILFEIATDPPGFPIDETPEMLGKHLQLPAQYEARRPQIERSLPPILVAGRGK